MNRIKRHIKKYSLGWTLTVILVGASLFYWKGIFRWFVGDKYAYELLNSGREYAAGPFKMEMDLNPNPPVVGKNKLDVHLQDRHGIPLEGAAITIAASTQEPGDIPEIPNSAKMHERGLGGYKSEFELSTEGTWTLQMNIRSVDGGHADFTFGFVPGASGFSLVHSAGSGTGGEDGDIAYYSCSMHPSVRSNDPGTCPICAMDLEPVTHEEAESGMVIIDAQRRQLIGVKTAQAEVQDLIQSISAVGKVTYDETRLTDVSLKFSGWIGDIFADYTGKFVRQGEPLFTIYSPELVTAQGEYLYVSKHLKTGRNGNAKILEAARARLLLWDLTDDQITSLAEADQTYEYVPIFSPVSGVVVKKHIVKGSRIETGKMLYRIADLDTLWIEADIYEYELPLVSVGMEVDITLSYLPEWEEKGKITYIYPYLDPKTRTGRVRIEVSNPDGTLKPDMYANVELRIPLGKQLTIPEGAVIFAGDTRLVFVDRGEGRLEPVKIKVGIKNKDVFEVLEGLQEGETVVTSANFLIAAESKLKGAVEKW